VRSPFPFEDSFALSEPPARIRISSPVSTPRSPARRSGPGPLLAPEQAVVLQTDPELARELARGHMKGYLRLPNYTNNLRRLGYRDEDLAGGGSDRLVDAIGAWGTLTESSNGCAP
jgi:hypothetical protein